MILPVEYVLDLLAIAVGIGCIWHRRDRFQGTTLVAPAAWAVGSLAMLGIVDVIVAANGAMSEGTLDALRYFGMTGVFCPLMAVLGAKRPQHVGWQWIVLSLWVVLALPVGEAVVLWNGGTLDIGPFRQWMIVILVFVGLGNYGLTRFSLASVTAVVGQLVLFYPVLPLIGGPHSSTWSWGIWLICAAILMAWWQTRRSPTNGGWDGLWVDFRDAFGLVWGLRVMERINATSKICEWNAELGWFGFQSEVPLGDSAGELERTFRTLLRRFVSPQWIQSHHGSLPSEDVADDVADDVAVTEDSPSDESL